MARESRANDEVRRAGAVLGALLLAAAGGSCADEVEPLAESSPIGLALARIRAHEDELRQGTDFTSVVGRNRALGPDPYVVALAPGGQHVLGVLRGEDAVVLLDTELDEVARAPAPRLASALTVDGDTVWVAGEGTGRVDRLAVGDATLVGAGFVDLGVGTSVRGLAAEGGTVFAVDAIADELVAFDDAGERARIPTAAGPLRVVATPRWVVVASLVGHRIEVFARDEDGAPVAPPASVYVRRGPAWAIDASEDGDGVLWVAAAGVEDEELDRTIGAFGHVDSVVELFRHGPAGLGRVASVDVAARGIVVPKSIALAVGLDTLQIRTVAAGAPFGIDVTWSREGTHVVEAESATWASLPGTTSFVGGPGAPVVGASPLFDAFWSIDPDASPDAHLTLARAAPVASRAPSVSERLGEALLTTNLLAPGQSSEGAYSRFTCETCHFELGIDGRTHLTGRDDHTAATTKPLFGLLENGPHFTRALDPDLTAVAHNEVRVANLHVAIDPWFSIDRGKSPWLDALIGDGEPGLLGPMGARRAIVDVLAALAHRPSLRAQGRTSFSERERRGGAIFRERCSACHAARLVTNDPSTEIAFEAWEGLVLSAAAPITWATDGYEKTGVEPYVHDQGARTTSLRRVIEKRPYFTNGSAATLAEVVARARFGSGGFFHTVDGPAARHEVDPAQLASFSDDDVVALLAFLELL